jgi:RsiW-degrading membrane proteinase PrsW (M82 family)
MSEDLAWTLVQALVASFAPSIIWLGYWFSRTPPGRQHVLWGLCFLGMGTLAGPLALGLYELLELEPFYRNLAGISQAVEEEKFAYTFFAVGPIEELAKFFVVWLTVAVFRPNLAPRVGGPLYAIGAALGFATIENWYYMLEAEEVAWHRALALPFNHVLFSSFWGVGLALLGVYGAQGSRWLVAGLVLSFIYHGIYDYIVLSERLSPAWVVPLIGVLWLWHRLALQRLHADAPLG